MPLLHPYSIFHLGDAALTIDFGNVIDIEVNNKVLRLFHHLKTSLNPFIIDLVPAYSSLSVYYNVAELKKKNPEQTAFDTMAEIIEEMTADNSYSIDFIPRKVEIPVCYNAIYGPDLFYLANLKKIEAKEIISLHTSIIYRVYMMGFLPGFSYMGQVDEKIACPRRDEPRIHVAAGSVGIAGRQTGIYPLDSPGGWQIIGCTPLKMFDHTKEQTAVLQAGDEVKFYSITEDEFEDYKNGHS